MHAFPLLNLQLTSELEFPSIHLNVLGWPKSLLGFFPYDLMENTKQSFWPTQYLLIWGFPGGSDGKESANNVGDPGLISGLGRSLEKEMATHSSILAWRIPWTEEPGGLQSMGSQRVKPFFETQNWINRLRGWVLKFYHKSSQALRMMS